MMEGAGAGPGRGAAEAPVLPLFRVRDKLESWGVEEGGGWRTCHMWGLGGLSLSHQDKGGEK